MPEINVRLLADPALAYVADAREEDLMKILETLGLSPRVSAWVAMRKEKPGYFLPDGFVEYVLARDVGASSGLCIRVVPIGMYEEAFSAVELVEMYDTRVDGVALGDLTLGPAEFSFGGSSGSIEVDVATLPVCDEYQAVQEKAPAASVEHAVLVAEDDPDMVCELPGYCYLKHFRAEDRLEALRELKADPSLLRMDEYVASREVRSVGLYDRARLAAVRTTMGWHVANDSRGDVGMLSPSEKLDDVLGRDAAWTNLVRPEFAEKFLSIGRAVTVQDMEECDSSWLRSDIVLWSYGIVRDAGVWYVLQCDGRLPAWAGQIELHSVVGRGEVVGEWAAPLVEGTRYFRVTIWPGQVGCDVEELILSGSEACVEGDVEERSGSVVCAEEAQGVVHVPVTPLVYLEAGAGVSQVGVGSHQGVVRVAVRYERLKSVSLIRGFAALVPFVANFVHGAACSPRVTRWVLGKSDGRFDLKFVEGSDSGLWMARVVGREAKGTSVIADVNYCYNVNGKLFAVRRNVCCQNAVGLYGPVVDAAKAGLLSAAFDEEMSGREVEASVDIEVFNFKLIECYK